MKSIEHLASDNGFTKADVVKDMNVFDGYICTKDNLEALCKEYMAEKLGELKPIAEVVSEKFADFMPPHASVKWVKSDFYIGAKFYDLSSLKGTK